MAENKSSALDQAWKFALRVDKELEGKIKETEPDYRDIDHLIGTCRLAFETVVFFDYEFATDNNAEVRMWEAHVKVNNRYRSILARFRERSKALPVQYRRILKQYGNFITDSTKFYRGFIQRLASHFNGIPELEEVARQFKLDPSTVDRRVEPSLTTRSKVLFSCNRSLVCLGDLARYKQSETPGRHGWSAAVGYYELANAIYPDSGASHNQLAVIALAEGNHLSATYHLYRALTVKEPYLASKGNLEVELRKITAAWRRGTLRKYANGNGATHESGMSDLVALFLRLHSQCYSGKEFPEHEELENDMLSQLAIDLKERAVPGGTLNEFVLVNISAEWCATRTLEEHPESPSAMQAYFFFLRLNLKTLFILLQVLQPELERAAEHESNEIREDRQASSSEKVTAVARRILPSLRHYSSWLVANSVIISSDVGDSALQVQIKETWKTYAVTLTMLAITFPAESLPSVDYLLEEDETTFAFAPFQHASVAGRYKDQLGKKRKLWHDSGVERCHPNTEMLARVRDFLIDGLQLAVDSAAPIILEAGGSFTFQDKDLPQPIPFDQPTYDTQNDERGDFSCLRSSVPKFHSPPPTYQIPVASAMASVGEDPFTETTAPSEYSMSNDLKRMVDSIVGPDEKENENLNANTIASWEQVSDGIIKHSIPTRPRTSTNVAFSEHDIVDDASDADWVKPESPAPVQNKHPLIHSTHPSPHRVATSNAAGHWNPQRHHEGGVGHMSQSPSVEHQRKGAHSWEMSGPGLKPGSPTWGYRWGYGTDAETPLNG